MKKFLFFLFLLLSVSSYGYFPMTPKDLVYLRTNSGEAFNTRIISLGFHLSKDNYEESRFISFYESETGLMKEVQFVKRKKDGAVNVFTKDAYAISTWISNLSPFLNIETVHNGTKVYIYHIFEKSIEISWQPTEPAESRWYTIACYN